MTYLTQTLIGSWQYMFDCREECQEEAREDFLKTLRKEPKEQTEAMLKGIEFEREAYDLAAGVQREYNPDTYTGAREVADFIKGAQIQVPAKRELTIRGNDYVVYGILDALRAGTIFDVKFLTKSFGSADVAGKYLASVQHPAYFFLVPEARQFLYLLSDGKDLYTECYTPEKTVKFDEIATQFVDSITEMGLYETYTERWQYDR